METLEFFIVRETFEETSSSFSSSDDTCDVKGLIGSVAIGNKRTM